MCSRRSAAHHEGVGARPRGGVAGADAPEDLAQLGHRRRLGSDDLPIRARRTELVVVVARQAAERVGADRLRAVGDLTAELSPQGQGGRLGHAIHRVGIGPTADLETGRDPPEAEGLVVGVARRNREAAVREVRRVGGAADPRGAASSRSVIVLAIWLQPPSWWSTRSLVWRARRRTRRQRAPLRCAVPTSSLFWSLALGPLHHAAAPNAQHQLQLTLAGRAHHAHAILRAHRARGGEGRDVPPGDRDLVATRGSADLDAGIGS